MYKILGLFLAFCLVLGPAAGYGRSQDAEAQAVAAVIKLGAKVTRDVKAEGAPVVALAFNETTLTDVELRLIKNFKSLRSLSLGNTKIMGAGLVELAGLPALHHLGLSHAPVTDVGLKGLKDFKSLRRLDLDRTLVTDAGLKELKGLKNLQTLSLSETQVTDLGLDDLKAIGSLHELYVGSTRLTDAGIKKLQAALPELRIMR